MKADEFTAYLLRKGYSKSTAARYDREVERFKVWCKKQGVPVVAVDYNDVLKYVKSLGKELKNNSTAAYLSGIKQYYNYLKACGVVAKNPTSQVQLKGTKRRVLHHILSAAELDSLYHNFKILTEDKDGLKQNWQVKQALAKQRNKAMLGLLIYQGLTSTELSRLTEKNIELRAGKVHISATRKSNARVLPLEAQQVMELMEYGLKTRPQMLQIADKQSELFFVSTGKTDNFNSIMVQLIDQLKKQNSAVKSVLQIRSSVITNWLRVYSLREVQYRAGHRFVSSTEAYKINDLEDLQEDVNKFHPLA